MQDFSNKKVSTVDAVLFRRLIVITAVVGSLLVLLSLFGCSAKFLCLSPSRVAFGVLYIEVALIIYGEVTRTLLFGNRSVIRIALALVAKSLWILGLFWIVLRSTGEERVATIVGILSFIPATIGAILPRWWRE